MQIISQLTASNQIKQINMFFLINHFINSNHSNTLELNREKWRTNQFIYGSNGAHMHIHIKPFRFSLSNKTQNRNKERSVKNKPKKVVSLQFLSSESHSWVKLPRHQPLIHHKYVTIKEEKKAVVHSRIFS